MVERSKVEKDEARVKREEARYKKQVVSNRKEGQEVVSQRGEKEDVHKMYRFEF